MVDPFRMVTEVDFSYRYQFAELARPGRSLENKATISLQFYMNRATIIFTK
jgi:hypothetical protein